MSLDVARLRHLAISDSGFVFDPLTGFTFSVNATGLFLLRTLKEGHALDELPELLRNEFEVDMDADVPRDVEDFIGRLRDQRLLQ